MRSDWVVIGLSVAFTIIAGVLHYLGGGAVLAFVAAAAAVALLAALVGRSVEQLGDRFGPGATGVLQSALGNLPELFISLFALQAGLVAVVQAALIGSILANLLLVLGLCLPRRRPQARHPDARTAARARTIVVLMLLSVAAMVMPSADVPPAHARPRSHENDALRHRLGLPARCSSSLTLPSRSAAATSDTAVAGAREGGAAVDASTGRGHARGQQRVAAAFVSDWFVDALQPAMDSTGISEAFAGLVVVAIAGNAIENVVGVQLAAKNRSEYAFAVVINSPLQIALVLAPLLVILSTVFGFASLTLVFSPLLVVVARRRRPAQRVHHLRRQVHLDRGRRAHRPLRGHRGDVLVGLSGRARPVG